MPEKLIHGIAINLMALRLLVEMVSFWSSGPRWMTDSIFNDSSSYASTWSQNSIFNTSSDYGNSYSSLSVFNDGASNPPMIIGSYGLVGYLSIGPSWDSDRYSPYDIKYTCDWD